MKRDAYESKRTRHSPRVYIGRDGAAKLMNGEPLCGSQVGPGATTAVDAMVSCPDCIHMLGEGHGVRS